MRSLSVLVVALVLAGCGAGAQERATDLDEEQPRGGEPADLGGPPPPSLTHGWETDFSKHSVPFAEI